MTTDFVVSYTHHLTECPVGLFGIDWTRESFLMGSQADADEAVRHLKVTRRNGVGRNEYDGFVVAASTSNRE